MGAEKDYLPASDAGLLAFSANFSSKISADPTSYGLVAADATAYAAKQSAYAAALSASTDPSTRGPATVLLKSEAKADLVQITRRTAAQVQGTMTVTNSQRQALGLTVRSLPQPIPIPGVAPAIDIVSIVSRTIRVRLHDASDASRLRPAGVKSAAVFSFVGAEPPADTSVWMFQGSTTRSQFDVVFPMSIAPGTQVWLTAFWQNPRQESGPACTPVGANLAGGGADPVAL